MLEMDPAIRFTLPEPVLELEHARRNLTLYLTEEEVDDVSRVADPEYEQFLADVWVGIVLTLMVLSCVCCMCSCLLYHKFQQWKRSVLEARRRNNAESGQTNDTESLPSYTIVSGLPSYDEAIEQLRKVQSLSKENISVIKTPGPELTSSEPWTPHTPPPTMTRLSVAELFQLYKNSNASPSVDSKT